ncbi:UDP-glycosyltransferase 74E2-like [Silene latifolia]|uniref:UDP-glycosyltransferase 74E2-like n=1 Tax=Silene latifolia TaxID=37657 RepID=UPI003D774792
MENNEEIHGRTITRGAHVLVLAFPLQGHINPILQFAKRLAFEGLKVTILIPSSSISHQAAFQYKHQSFNLEVVRIYDGYEEEPDKRDVDAYLYRLRTSVSQSLSDILDHYKKNNQKLQPTPKMVIYDSLMPWVLDVVKKDGFEGAPFFTQSCVVNSIYYHFNQGELKIPITGSNLVSLPAIKSFLKVEDLPGFVTSAGLAYPGAIINMLIDQFSNVKEATCLFVNTLDKFEIEVIEWMENICPVKTIGPCIPSKYLDNRIPDDMDYGLSLFEPETNACIQWLNARDTASVVYVSMGSMASLQPDQMKEIAVALLECNRFFLWVVRTSEENKLPFNFKEDTSDKGLIVNWSPQLEVLAHEAIGCFVTHCGWNSTLEAVSLGVPMVGFPQWSDQFTNAKCIKDFWGIGVRVKANEDGFVTKEEIEMRIHEVMEGESAKEMRQNAKKWKQLAVEGGTSANNIQEFVTKLQCVI